jgi:hypothetical protein
MANKRKSDIDIENHSQLAPPIPNHVLDLMHKVPNVRGTGKSDIENHSQLALPPDNTPHPPRAITAIYCHLGVYICSRAETTFKASQGYKLTETDRGIMVQSPDAPSVTSKPGHYVLVPWSNLHAVAYEPDHAAE